MVEPLKLYQPNNWYEEDYFHLTDKVLNAFKDIYKEHNDYAWYFKADDDPFLNYEHFNEFFSNKNPKLAATYGFELNYKVEKGYPSGSGYVLSNEAFNLLGEKLVEHNTSFCSNTGTEDYDIGMCLRKLNIFPENSKDEFERDSFHPFSITDHYIGSFPKWFYERQFANKTPKTVPIFNNISKYIFK